MTRQKKELMKRIMTLTKEIDELSEYDDRCVWTFKDANRMKELFREIENTAEKLAQLRGFKDQQEELEYECRVHPPTYLPYI